MILYLYRCATCGRDRDATPEQKNIYGSSDGSRIDLVCETFNCRGVLRRVWGARVQTASVPGFHKHETHGMTETPD